VCAAGHAHRAYVIDDQEKPTAVVSFTDILNRL
jgi:hypothetical protein